MERVLPGPGASPRPGLACFPVLLPSWQQIAWVPLRCALVLQAWAGTAPLPGRYRNRLLPAAQRACPVARAAAQHDGGFRATPGHRGAGNTDVAARLVRVARARARPARRCPANSGTRHHEPPGRRRSVSGRHAGRHDRCPPDLHDATDPAQRPPALRLSLIHSLIQLRPETSSVHQSAPAAQVADPPDLRWTQSNRLGKRGGSNPPRRPISLSLMDFRARWDGTDAQ
jgi:hypothetical protein